jgi:hypothetical protein
MNQGVTLDPIAASPPAEASAQASGGARLRDSGFMGAPCAKSSR